MKERSTCCYIYHVEIGQLRLGLNNMRVTFELHGIKKCNCTCPYICLRNANQFSCLGIYSHGFKTTWNFFGYGHGKGLHDGAGVAIKRLIQKEQLDANGAKLQNAKEVVQFLHEHLSKRLKTSYSSARRPLWKVFWLVKEEEVPKNALTFNCDSIKGTMKLHSILATNQNNLL